MRKKVNINVLIPMIICLSLTIAHGTEYRILDSSAATSWADQCYPVGNGSIGAMIYGGFSQEQLQFNEITLWKGGTANDGGTGCYLGFGDIYVTVTNPSSTTTNYCRDLDIGEATSHVKYTSGGYDFSREYFCSYPDSVIVGHFTSSGSKQITLLVNMSALSALTYKKISASGNTIIFSGYYGNSGYDVDSISFEAQVYVKNYNGTIAVVDSNIKVTNADSVDIIFSAATNFIQSYTNGWRGNAPHSIVSTRISAASAKTYSALRSAHIADYQTLFNRFTLDLGDSIYKSTPTKTRKNSYTKGAGNDRGLDVLFTQMGRYLIISSSRSSLPANLQGLWNNSASPTWNSDYHSDINVTMNYSHVEPLNLSECMIPFVNFVDAQREIRHTRTVSKYSGVRGWTVQTETNHMGGNSWNWNNPGSAWYCNLMWDHYLFTKDTAYLRDTALPIMKEVCQFWQDHLVDSSGWLETPDGWSPENTYGYEIGVTYDQQLIWDVFTNYSKAEAICKSDTSFKHEVDSMLKILDPGLRIGASGDLQEWKGDKQGESNHRHISHLVGLYPGFQISPLINTTYSNAAKKALIIRGDGSTGWSCAWRADCWARLFNGDSAYNQMGLQLINYVFGNMLDQCNYVFQIDGNCGISSAVAEMLVQSHTDKIHLLPALPSAWPEGSVIGLKARGNYDVGITWAGDTLTRATIKPAFTDSCRIMTNTKIKVMLNGSVVTMNRISDSVVVFLAVASNTYVVQPVSSTGISINSVIDNKGRIFLKHIADGRILFNITSGIIADMIDIMDIKGRLVRKAHIVNNSVILGNLPPGIYRYVIFYKGKSLKGYTGTIPVI
jgi:alpha-L-fucosidase 2